MKKQTERTTAQQVVISNLSIVTQQIALASERVGRADRPCLVAVSKRQADERIDAALDAGHRVFGENRVLEAQQRWSERRAIHDDLCLHLIGALQTNKAAEAVALFDIIEVIDRPKLARALAAEMQKANRHLDCYVQVNTGEEAQKSGVMPDDLDALLDICRGECGLRVTGLMCIPPVEEEPAMHFALLRSMAERHGLTELSMGMSGDFEDAVAFGATSVRVGSAIFGARDTV
jgi:pyridoxal phosphate enzyme (YggS family)